MTFKEMKDKREKAPHHSVSGGREGGTLTNGHSMMTTLKV
jgi:hypothetical protein